MSIASPESRVPRRRNPVPEIRYKTGLGQRRRDAEKGKNGASDTNELSNTSVESAVSGWNAVAVPSASPEPTLYLRSLL